MAAVGPLAAGQEIQGLLGYERHILRQRVIEGAGNVLQLQRPVLLQYPEVWFMSWRIVTGTFVG